jgi:hypothetical protein
LQAQIAGIVPTIFVRDNNITIQFFLLAEKDYDPWPRAEAGIFEDVRAVVRWAVQNEYLNANPLDGMGQARRGDVEQPRSQRRGNSNTLDRAAGRAWRSEQCQRIVKLCLVTAQRVCEVAGITRSETSQWH